MSACVFVCLNVLCVHVCVHIYLCVTVPPSTPVCMYLHAPASVDMLTFAL